MVKGNKHALFQISSNSDVVEGDSDWVVVKRTHPKPDDSQTLQKSKEGN